MKILATLMEKDRRISFDHAHPIKLLLDMGNGTQRLSMSIVEAKWLHQSLGAAIRAAEDDQKHETLVGALKDLVSVVLKDDESEHAEHAAEMMTAGHEESCAVCKAVALLRKEGVAP